MVQRSKREMLQQIVQQRPPSFEIAHRAIYTVRRCP